MHDTGKFFSFQRRRGGISVKAIIGILLILSAGALYVSSSGHTEAKTAALKEAKETCVAIKDANVSDPAIEGKLAFLSGTAKSSETLTDNLGISTPGSAVLMSRTVSYYQWVETVRDKKVGDKTITEYRYSREWVDSPVNSLLFKSFGYTNSTLLEVKKTRLNASAVKIGAYKLPSFAVAAMSPSASMPIVLTPEKIAELERLVVTSRSSSSPVMEQYVHVVAGDANQLYFGRNPRIPEIGDVVVTYLYTPSEKVSLIGKVQGGALTEAKTSDGIELHFAKEGTMTFEGMFDYLLKDTASTGKLAAVGSAVLGLIGVWLLVRGLRS